MSSILTNNSAMVALQTLKGINTNLAKAQDEISTGKSVATAKDNSAVWAISKVMESDVAGLDAISDSLSLGQSTVGVAAEASETIVEKLKEAKKQIIASQGANVDRSTIQDEITALSDTVTSIIKGAQFNGQNLLITGAADMTVLASLDRAADQTVTASSITVAAQDLEADLADFATIDVSDDAGSLAALTTIEELLSVATKAAAAFGSSQTRITAQADFVSSLSDAMTSGIGTLVDADMEEASARLTALQTQQQLGIQALQIANQQPQTILSLFQ